jgi:DUF971 family protein
MLTKQQVNPVEVQLRKLTGTLDITWSDGEMSKIAGGALRRHCACSGCRSRQMIGTELITDSAKIEKINLMGSTGLQIIFADGHDRGVFPWAYIHAIANDCALEYLDQ